MKFIEIRRDKSATDLSRVADIFVTKGFNLNEFSPLGGDFSKILDSVKEERMKDFILRCLENAAKMHPIGGNLGLQQFDLPEKGVEDPT